eukprot:CAMPEP_0176047662 /NCGR_PEP_ID=MMETSP0120_2-20121206/23672_1 /TAXON_ID=160619 /ORGANISM="Kryptoperidinium foliaceum, Strain CCMP 1326" /LENGTH=399 /DNA_ID=CAMNT_0017381077 /DNA_START=41 /DNA_END=1240 /DNA_ORIENTATION=-
MPAAGFAREAGPVAVPVAERIATDVAPPARAAAPAVEVPAVAATMPGALPAKVQDGSYVDYHTFMAARRRHICSGRPVARGGCEQQGNEAGSVGDGVADGRGDMEPTPTECRIRTFSHQVKQLQASTASALLPEGDYSAQPPLPSTAVWRSTAAWDANTEHAPTPVVEDATATLALQQRLENCDEAGCIALGLVMSASSMAAETAARWQHRMGESGAASSSGGVGAVLREPLRLWRARALHLRRLEQLGLEEVGALRLFSWTSWRGNCQFVSVAYLLWGMPERHLEVREAAVAQIVSFPDRYQSYIPGSVEAFAASMAEPGAWGDVITLIAISDAFSVNINVVSSTSEQEVLSFGPKNAAATGTLWLSFFEAHYKPLEPKAGAEARSGDEDSPAECVVS